MSELDARLRRTYRDRQALLSQQGAKLLQQSEQAWLHFVSTVCPLNLVTDAMDRRNPKNCLAEQYGSRLRALSAVGRSGIFVFNRVDRFAARPANDDTGGTIGFFVQHVAFPQIDSPSSSREAAWNNLILHNAPVPSCTSDDCEDQDVDYHVGYATQRLISVEWTKSFYGHGAAHGNGIASVQNVVLLPAPHELTEREIFGADGNWAARLRELFSDALRQQGWNPRDAEARKEVLDIVTADDRWAISTEGLTVSFSSYEGGCYACTPKPITVHWPDLKPLLAAHSIVP